METFSKLRPPEAVRIKAKLIESSSNNDQETSSSRLDCDHNHNNSPVHHLDECVEGGIRRASTMSSRNKDRRISSASQVSTISTSSSSCTSYGGGSVSSSAPPHQTNPTSDQRICELKKFCVDPQVTSFDVLRDLIAHAFAIKSEFRLSYLNRSNDNKQEMSESEERSPSYISLQTDWDLDAAFSSSSQPYLSLNIELLAPPAASSFQSPNQQQIAAEAISEEWEVINSSMPSSSSSASSSPVPADTTTNSASSSSGDQPSSPKTSLAVVGQKLIPKSRSTVIHKCVSAIHKVFNNLARSNSFNNTPLTTSPNEPRRVSEIEEEEDHHRRCLMPSLSVPRSPSLSGAGTAPPPVSPQVPTTPHNTSTTTYSERSTAATVAAAAAALLTGGAQFYHKAPLGEAELRNFCDSDGRIVNLVDLKQRIFEGGCEAAKRRELWPILLDIYPHVCATRQQRDDFLRLKQAEYAAAKHSLWMRDHRDLMARSSAHCISDSSFDSNNPHGGANLSAFGLPPHHGATFDLNALYSLAHKIHKDVCRTDRNQKFFAGDCNPNVASLFNILITYSMAHPHMPYAQGMSDLLSPLLYVLRDESLAYACFVALMNRCAPDFCVHSDSISLKIKLLGSLLARYDPELWSHLVHVGADQMLFVYRWLLLECKREFPFEDSLRVLECMWSTIDNTSSTPTAIWSNNMDMMSRSSYLTRSNSTVSSSTVSLRLFKDICRTGGVAGLRAISNDDYGISNVGGGASEEPDDDFVGSENMDESMSIGASTKSRHQSQASSTATNNHVSHKETCDMCRGSSTTTANNSERKSSPSLMIKRRTSSTIDDLSSDLSSSTRSRTSSSSSSLTSSSSIISDDEESDEISDSSDICDDLDGLLKNDDDDDEDFKPVEEEESKSAKPMAVARLRRFSLNLSFLKSSSKSKTKRDAKLDEIATPPTSASLTNELECSNLINRQRRFQLNKRFFSIIKKKKETTNSRVESNENEFYCSSPQQELKEKKSEERQSRCRHLSNQPSVVAVKSPVRSKSLGNLDHVDIGESPSWIRSRAKSSGVPASTARQCEAVIDRCLVRVCNEQGRLLLAKKKSSLPVYMKAATAVNAVTANQIAMSSSTKFSTSEAETIVMAASNNQSANNLRSSFCRQLSHSPTIVNTVGSQKLSHKIHHNNYHRSTPKGKKTTQDENTKEASKSNREKSTRGEHKKSSRRTRARQYCPKTTTTTTTGEDESERGTMKRARRKKPHRHHEKKTAVVSTSPSFKHIKSSLKRSQRYLNSFYASKMRTTTTTTSTKIVETETTKKPVDSANKPANDEKVAANTTCACVAARANTNGTANSSTATCNRSQTSKCTNNTHSSSKSSTSAYVSAAHSLASSHSSLCSTNFNQISHPLSNGYSNQQHQQQQSKVATSTTTSSRRSSFVSKQIPIINITSPVSGATKSVAVDEQESEEELIYQLSKLDNPFLLFMCLSMFIEHRKHIMRSQMDANDIACYFDKMARKHCVRPILARARYLYTKLYLAKANVFSYIQQLMDIQNSP